MIRLLLITCIISALSQCSPPSSSPMNSQPDTPPIAATNYSAQDLIAGTLPEIADALRGGGISAEELVKLYLLRITQVDQSGPSLQSVLTLNPDILQQARALDEKRAAGEPLGPLHGVPILLKDNIETSDKMATTAGALALKDNLTDRDSPLVAGLREAGALILGKTNLSQWANFRSNHSMSGWTALGGQVRNPHMLSRNPCGSSSGSGAATAASLAAGTVGTETNGSVICPSNVNGVVGFKPSVGLVSQQYIVPISASQDTAGPMTKSVRGAAMMLNAMATGPRKTDYLAGLEEGALSGIRVGVLRYSVGDNRDIVELFDSALLELEAAGAILIEIQERPSQVEGFGSFTSSVMKYEFKAGLNEYLASTPNTVATRSLTELIEFNIENAEVELALFGQDIFKESNALPGLEDPAYIFARNTIQSASRENGIDALLHDFRVGVLVAPSGPVSPRIDPINGDVWPPFPGAGGMAAIAGYPHLTVPMGVVHKIPVGISFIGANNADAKVLSYGYAFEQRSMLRAEPQYLENAEAISVISSAMKRK